MRSTSGRYFSRRGVLAGSAALAGATLLGAPSARAQANKRVVLSTWGGDYAELLTKNISKPLMAPKGWEVVNDEAGSPQRITKVIAERRLPKGSSDIQALAATTSAS